MSIEETTPTFNQDVLTTNPGAKLAEAIAELRGINEDASDAHKTVLAGVTRHMDSLATTEESNRVAAERLPEVDAAIGSLLLSTRSRSQSPYNRRRKQ